MVIFNTRRNKSQKAFTEIMLCSGRILALVIKISKRVKIKILLSVIMYG